jgi:hypothetical protein
MYYLDPGFHRDDESELFLKSKRLDRSVLLSDTKKNIQWGFSGQRQDFSAPVKRGLEMTLLHDLFLVHGMFRSTMSPLLLRRTSLEGRGQRGGWEKVTPN